MGEVEEDFLDVDKTIPGQNFVCLSFVSPDKVIKSKEEFYFYKYLQDRVNGFNDYLNTQIEEIVKNSENNTVNVTQVVQLKKKMASLFEQEQVSADDFKGRLGDFSFKNHKDIDNEFDSTNDYKTSVRGVKVRGVYDSHREAEIRAKVLQRMDQTFDVFVGQVGYWLPWDPESSKVENQEYLNDNLNKLVKEYKTNEIKKDMFYQEQTRQRKQEAMTVSERLKKKLEAKRRDEQESEEKRTKNNEELNEELTKKAELDAQSKNEMNNSNMDSLLSSNTNDVSISDNVEEPNSTPFSTSEAPVDTLENTITSLQQEDPWMQRKLEDQNN
jgi:hypothetical protein